MTYINGGHWQWISWYLTQPPPCCTVYSPSLCCRSLPCMWDVVGGFWTVGVKTLTVPQVCIPLFLLPVINTTPQAVARAQPRNTTRSSTYFALPAEEGWEGLEGTYSGFYRTTPKNTWALWATESNTDKERAGRAFQYPPGMLGCIFTVKSCFYPNIRKNPFQCQLYMSTCSIAYGQHVRQHTP